MTAEAAHTSDEFLPQFAAQAVVDLENQARILNARPNCAPYVELCRKVATLLREAVHVVLPMNGEVYRNNGPDCDAPSPEECESLLGLPAPVTAFEYPWNHDKGNYAVQAPKRITIVVSEKQITPETTSQLARISFLSVFYDEQLKKWTVADHMLVIPAQPECLYGPTHSVWGFKQADLFSLIDGYYLSPGENGISPDAGQYFADVLSVTQCCHALRAGARFVERTESSGSRRKKFRKKGVEGFVYHVLKLPEGVSSHGPPAGGTHASPRFHLRRAHIRKLSSGSLTFVRHCFVGNREKGVVEKNYAVPAWGTNPSHSAPS